MTISNVMRGIVEAFDADVGLGTLVDDAGRPFDFHCTAIADGTRLIAAGTAVVFVVGAAGPGRWEAIEVSPI